MNTTPAYAARGRTNRKHGRSAGRDRIQGFSSVNREEEIDARVPALAFLTSGEPAAIQAALRAMRRASHVRGSGYDPIRHAALLRLHKMKAPPVEVAPCAIGPQSKI